MLKPALHNRPLWFWQRSQRQGLYAPFRAGHSSLFRLFESTCTWVRPPTETAMVIGLRDPYERFCSQWHMILHGKPHDPVTAKLLQGLRGCGVQAAQNYLEQVFPVFEAWRGNHHYTSQSTGIQHLLDDPADYTVQYIHITQWPAWLNKHLGIHNYRIENHIPTDYQLQFESLRPVIKKVFAQDYDLINSLDINTV